MILQWQIVLEFDLVGAIITRTFSAHSPTFPIGLVALLIDALLYVYLLGVDHLKNNYNEDPSLKYKTPVNVN